MNESLTMIKLTLATAFLESLKGNQQGGESNADGVKLYRFAVPNRKTIDKDKTEYWDKPQFKIRQDQTGVLYDKAIDIENKGYTYTETDIPVELDIE